MSRKEFTEEELQAIRFENEFLRAKIIAEFGATQIYINPDLDLSPEIENDFLKMIANRDDVMEDVDEIPIFDFLGKPSFVKAEELNDEQLPVELDRVQNLLYDHKIICDTICDVDDRVFYKFLTEELFQHPILNLPDSEIGSHFFYETFHPTQELDSRCMGEDFLNLFFSDEFYKEIQNYAPEQIRNFVDLVEFRDSFCEFRNVEFELHVLPEVHPDECTRTGTISFDAITDSGTKPIHFEGNVTLVMNYMNNDWVVIHILLPGMADIPY